MLFSGVWPLAERDTVTISHWRLLPDGKIILITFSEDEPEIEGVIRAELKIGALVITPTSYGCFLQYIIDCDLKGSIPDLVSNYIVNLQPLNIANIRNILEKEEFTDIIPTNKRDYLDYLTKKCLSYHPLF
jgi:hypothetical protein